MAEILETDALETMTEDRGRSALFYAQSWAFVHYMREASPDDVAESFAEWEELCFGAALGADATNRRSRNTAPARQLFLQTFSDDLEEIERGYREFLRQL